MANQSAVLLSNLRKDLLESLPDLDLVPTDPSHCLDAQAAAVASLLRDIVKKEVPAPSDKTDLARLEKAAVDKFLWANDRCKQLNDCTHSDFSEYTQCVIREAQAFLARLPEVGFPQAFARGRVASGSSIASGGRNSELEKLFLNQITSYQQDTIKQYLRFVGLYPTYRIAEKQRQVSLGVDTAFRIVGSSQFSTVRKSFKTDRGICTEASLDMFFQLGVGELLNEFLCSEFGYCEKTQPDRNRNLVLYGSVSGDTASIDSTSASDLWARAVVKMLMVWRPDWYEMLMQLRASSTVLPDGTVVDLHMISSMGNGFTFPLETLLFGAVVKAVATVEGVRFSRFDCPDPKMRRYGVFGDDIICPAEIAEKVMLVLSELGHVPNLDKSYIAGPYRESCGVDAFKGVDVRSVFHKHWSRQGRYATINALNMWSARWGIPLRRTVRFLLPKGWKDHLIPMYSDPSEGIYPPTELTCGPYTKWAASPNVEEIYFTRVQRESDGKVRYHMLRQRFWNPFGVLLCHVAGSIRNGVVTRRDPPNVCDDDKRSEVTSPELPVYWVCSQELRLAGVSRDMWTALAGINLAI